MTTTTFENVGGMSQPAEEPAAEPAESNAAQVAAEEPAAEPEPESDPPDPPRKPGTFIPGEGTIPVHTDGAMRRVPRGKIVELSEEELAFLKRNEIKFT